MTNALRAVFTETGRSTYGPRKSNPEYAARDENGRMHTVTRHRWTLPASSWAWKAVPWEPGTKTIYADTLVELAEALGHDTEGRWA